MRLLFAAALTLALSGFALAQHQHETAPYAGKQNRSVKALSDQQIADLRAGRGMGYALTAELNGYPGPSHVLDLADQLGLKPETRARVQALFDNMKTEAIAEGQILIAREAGLDRAFANGTISQSTLSEQTASIGETQARLRAIHLKYHLSTAELLSEDQRRRYSEIRGYR